MTVIGGKATDTGVARQNNQDAVVYHSLEQRGQYFIVGAVCDGIGGLEHGEAASGLIQQCIDSWFAEVSRWIRISEMEGELLFSNLKDAAESWNLQLMEMAQQQALRTGTTMSLLMILREEYYFLQVGDSRIYCCRDELQQLTVDAVTTGMKNGRVKNYLNNFMGKQESLYFTSGQGKIAEKELFLICSDGLYHYLTPEDMAQAKQRLLGRGAEPDRECRTLVEAMMGRGETDNISACLIMVQNQRKIWPLRGKAE